MISEIRSYFKSIISEVDSDLREHDRYFVSEDIAITTIEDDYHLVIGQINTNRQDVDMNGTISVTLKFWKNGKNNEIERFDLAYSNALEIQTKIMDQSRIDQLKFMKSVIGSSVEPKPSLSNDNLAEFELQFTVTVGYKSI